MTTTEVPATSVLDVRTVPSAVLSDVPAPSAVVRPPLGERLSGVTVLLLAVDLASVGAALLVTRPPGLWVPTVATAVIAAGVVARLYRRRLLLSWSHELPRSLASAAAAIGALAVLGLGLGSDADTFVSAAHAVLLSVAIGALPRMAVFRFGRWARCHLGRSARTIVLGTGGLGVDLARSMQEDPAFGLLPVGYIDLTPPRPGVELPVPLLQGTLREAIAAERASVVVIAFTNATDAQIVDAAITAHSHGATILMVPRMWELYADSADVERLRGYPLVRLTGAPAGRPSWWVKRTTDWLLAALALVLAAPFLAAAALAVVVESGRPILFRQDRVGLDGRIFTLLKLRTMRPADEYEAQTTWNIAGDPRIGRVGRMLRRTSLDELPQLWNILRGDMSLVGPRPERPGFVRQFSLVHDRYWARHRVPAGLTGLAQVNGLRGDTSIADRSRYDNYYIANWSLWLDLRILLSTVREVFRSGQH